MILHALKEKEFALLRRVADLAELVLQHGSHAPRTEGGLTYWEELYQELLDLRIVQARTSAVGAAPTTEPQMRETKVYAAGKRSKLWDGNKADALVRRVRGGT